MALAACVAAPLVATAQPQGIDKHGPFFEALMAGPVPADVGEMLFVHDVLRIVHEDVQATRMYRMAERSVLLAILGESPAPASGSLAAALAADPPADLESLRTRALVRSIVPVKDAPAATPQQRSFRNHSAVAVIGFEVLVAAPSGQDLRCSYEGSLEPRAVATLACIPQAGPSGVGDAGYSVRGVRVEPGSYLNRQGGGIFRSTAAATQARLAAMPRAALERPRAEPLPAAERKAASQRWELLFSLAFAALGFAIGWPVGAWFPRPWALVGAIAFASLVLLTVAGAAVTDHYSGYSRINDTGGMSTLIAMLMGFGLAIVALAVWIPLSVGLGLGAWAGTARRRNQPQA